ncbi:MAG TPA: hypothetical protein VGR70_05215 [Stellaceae bacterium]|nr:hypothetical protein [Stellaceae bacterium]
MYGPLPDLESLRPSPPEWTEQRALDEKPPPEPVKIPLGWRIVGWICQALFSFGGG